MLIQTDTLAEKPIYEQLRDNIILGIASGQLAEGEHLPSARMLASELGVNFHTVNKAYDSLRTGGYILTDRRKKALVAAKKSGGALCPALAEKLRMCAAEGICAGMDEKTFVQACADHYKKAKEGGNNG